jgi:hypothetical protein
MVGIMGAGCAQPVPRVPPPAPGYETTRRDYEPVKPLSPQGPVAIAGPQPFYDEPLLIDTPPEARRFVEAYRQVGRPRIVIFVNRTLEGQIVPAAGDEGPAKTVEKTRKATTGVNVESRDYRFSADRSGEKIRDTRDKFQTTGAGEYTERTVVYLHPGEYDEIQAKGIDYGMMEMLLTDWMSADNQVAIVSPLMARKKLTAEQVKELESGRPQVLSEIAKQLDADILIQIQARPTRQTGRGLELRILADVMDLQRGESLARGAVDLEPPLDKIQMNRYTRFLARKLMDGMATTWSLPPAPAPEKGAAPPPANDKGLGPRLDNPPPGNQNR